MFKIFNALLKTLKENPSPKEIAHGVACGIMLGFIPKGNLLWIILSLIFIFLRINKGMFLLFIFLGSSAYFFMDGLFDIIGYAVLTIPGLEPLFRAFFNIPLMIFTKLNNSVVMGALLFSIAVYVPVFFAAKAAYKPWHIHIGPRISAFLTKKKKSKKPESNKGGEQ